MIVQGTHALLRSNRYRTGGNPPIIAEGLTRMFFVPRGPALPCWYLHRFCQPSIVSLRE
jgi:hypothetical protein